MRFSKYLTRSLMGSFDIFMLMPHAEKYFANNTKQALWSFIAPLAVAVYILLITYHIDGTSEFVLKSYLWLLLWTVYLGAIKMAIFLGLSYEIIRVLGRKHLFAKFVNANNWLMVSAAMALTLPWLMLFFGQTMDIVMPCFLCAVFYVLLMLCVMAKYVLDISWMITFTFAVACVLANAVVSVVLGKFLAGMFIF